MHAAVFADIEGSFGIWRMRQCRTGTPEWQYGRECLTKDVNSVVRGAFDGGATSVTVKDTHETGFNILTKKLDPRAKYIGGHYTAPTFFGNVSDYDIVLYVAIHAASGTPGAFFPHTHYGIFSEVRVNGTPVSEMEIYGAYLGEFGVPVGFFSGEAVAVEQAARALPWARSVVVDKRKETYQNGDNTIGYLERGREELRATAEAAVRDAAAMKPLKLQGPFHIEAVFRSEKLAARMNTWNFKQTGETVAWDAADMIEGFDKFNKLTFFNKKMYPYRRPLLFAARQYYKLKTTILAPAPNPEARRCKCKKTP